MRVLEGLALMVMSVIGTAACGGSGDGSADGTGGSAGSGATGGSGGSAGGAQGGTGGTGGSAGTGATGGAAGAGATAGAAGAAGMAGMGGVAPTLAPPPDYSQESAWACLPGGTDDTCDGDYDATILRADGTMEVEPHVRAVDPPIDCFYVYPTVSSDAGFNSDLDPATPAGATANSEINVTRDQAGRLTRACSVYAPLYRQSVLSGFVAGPYPDGRRPLEVAYDDVVAAFDYYMDNYNAGRPFVLAGHSQGSLHLADLLRDRFDDDPTLRAQLVSALIIGAAVVVPDGQDIGGTYQNIPLCRDASETGCIINYSTYRDTEPPGPGALFASDLTGSNRAACTNPAALGGGAAFSTPYFTLDGFGNLSPDQQSMITTPWVTMPGLLEVECTRLNQYDYLELRINADASDPRPDDITGDLPGGWGMHLADVHIAMGDLVSIVETQAAAFTTP